LLLLYSKIEKLYGKLYGSLYGSHPHKHWLLYRMYSSLPFKRKKKDKLEAHTHTCIHILTGTLLYIPRSKIDKSLQGKDLAISAAIQFPIQSAAQYSDLPRSNSLPNRARLKSALIWLRCHNLAPDCVVRFAFWAFDLAAE
jgi:hypothetical protein